MKTWLGAAVALLATALSAPSPAHAQDEVINRLRTGFSVLGFQRPLATGDDACRARPDQRTCMLGNGAIVWLDDRAPERRAIAYILTARHVLRALCTASSQNAEISTFGGPNPMTFAPVQIVTASCQDQTGDADIAIVQVDISRLRYPAAESDAAIAPPARTIRTVPIGPTLRDGALYRAFGFDRDHRAIDYAPKAAERLEDSGQQTWEFYIRVPSNPGLSGSPVLAEHNGDLAVVGVIARDPPLERCLFPPDSGEVSDLQTSRCEMRQNKVNWLVSVGVELQRARTGITTLPLDRLEVADGRRRIDAIRRYYDQITRPMQNQNATLASLHTAFEDGGASSLAPNITSWGAYFRSLSPLQVTRLLAYWEERFPNCLVPEAVAFQFNQIASSIYDESQIEQLIQDTNQKCPQERFRALQNSANLLQGLGASDRGNQSVNAFADNLGERFNLTREQVFNAAGDRNLSAVLSDRARTYQAVQ